MPAAAQAREQPSHCDEVLPDSMCWYSDLHNLQNHFPSYMGVSFDYFVNNDNNDFMDLDCEKLPIAMISTDTSTMSSLSTDTSAQITSSIDMSPELS